MSVPFWPQLGVARLYDLCTGHGPCPPRPNIQGSPDTFCNHRPVHRLFDSWAVHCLHSSILADGSYTIFTNHLKTGRCTDPVACGSFVMTCSLDTFGGTQTSA